MLWVVELLFRCLFLINAASSIGTMHSMWRQWLPSQIFHLFFVCMSLMSSMVLYFLVQEAHWGIPKVHLLLEWWVRQFPLLVPLFICLVWISVVLISSLLGLSPRVKSELVHEWAFVHSWTGSWALRCDWVPPSHIIH